MTKTNENSSGNDGHEELAGRFAQMRTEERASAPGFPSQAELLKRKPITQDRAVNARYASVAAAIALLALGIGWFSYQPADDPVAIYASIMDRQPVATDQLLMVSESVLPGMSDVPSFDAFELQFEQNYYTN